MQMLRLDRNSLNTEWSSFVKMSANCRCRQDIEDADLTDGNLLSDKMKINLHMLGALMLNRVGGEVHGTDIVAVDKCAPRRRGLELVEQLMQPSGLSHAVCNGTMLSLNAGAGDDGLPLG
jgi:hypothetical protein